MKVVHSHTKFGNHKIEFKKNQQPIHGQSLSTFLGMSFDFPCMLKDH